MKVIEFRPLKTERDKLLEQAVSNFSESELAIEENIKATCYRLIDAGWRPADDNQQMTRKLIQIVDCPDSPSANSRPRLHKGVYLVCATMVRCGRLPMAHGI